MQQGDRFTHIFTVDAGIYYGFIELFHDKNPLHTNAEFAREKGFRGPVMHGNILNGFVSYFVGECLPQKNVIIHAQSIKYSLPVYEGDVLEMTAEISGFFESVNTYEFKFWFMNTAGKKVARGDIQVGLI